MRDTSTVIRCYTVGDLLGILIDLPRETKVRVEVTGKLAMGIQLSIRENLLEAVVTKNKLVLRALDREGWIPEPRSEGS